MEKQRVIVVDDHSIFRKGIVMILEALDQYEVVAEASDGQEFLGILDVYTPDIVLMDIKMPNLNGVEATRLALKKVPGLKIIAFSMFGDPDYYNQMLEAGVKGFILKNSEVEDLKKSIGYCIQGQELFLPGIVALAHF